MKQSELVRRLTQMGAKFKDGANHKKAYLNGRMAPIPRHPSQEIKKGTLEKIKKTLKIEF